MSNYLIGSISSKSDDSYLNEAFLFEVEYLNGPPILMDIQTKSNYEILKSALALRKQDERKRAHHRVVYLKFFKIKKILMKATDGTNHIKGQKLKDHTLQEEKDCDINLPTNRKHFIHYRYKFSKDDLKLIKIGEVYCCPDDMTNLIFEEENEKDAIRTFKDLVPNLYFGRMNSNINFDWCTYTNYFDEYFTGRSDYNGRYTKTGITKNDYDYFKKYELDTVCGKLVYDISDSNISFNLWGTINQEFKNKLSFLHIILEKNPDNFLMLFNLIKHVVPEFDAFYLRPMSFDIDYLKCPLPCFKFTDAFDLDLKHLGKELSLITDNYKEFLFNRDYFVMHADIDDMRAIKSSLKFLSDDIEIQQVYDKKPELLKKFLEEIE